MFTYLLKRGERPNPRSPVKYCQSRNRVFCESQMGISHLLLLLFIIVVEFCCVWGWVKHRLEYTLPLLHLPSVDGVVGGFCQQFTHPTEMRIEN